jgi:hypothetical protein
VFARGWHRQSGGYPRDYKELLDYGILVTALTCISGALSWLGDMRMHGLSIRLCT